MHQRIQIRISIIPDPNPDPASNPDPTYFIEAYLPVIENYFEKKHKLKIKIYQKRTFKQFAIFYYTQYSQQSYSPESSNLPAKLKNKI